jgi:branched-chain amino acid transport system ATP-binding protein
MPEALIETKNLTISFGGHKAVNNVSISIEKGLFTTIIGPNGAGKTTFFNLVSGLLQPTEGTVLFKGTDITRLSPMQRVAMGIGRSFQLTNVFPALTVRENVRLAVQARENIGYRIFTSHKRFKAVEEEANALLEQALLESKVDTLAGELTHGEQRKLELAMVLALKPEVLLLDEPTAGMALEEVPAMFDLLTQTKQEQKNTIVLIEHKMDFVMGLSDTVIVIVNGSVLTQGNPQDVSSNPEVLKAYLGGGILCETRA